LPESRDVVLAFDLRNRRDDLPAVRDLDAELANDDLGTEPDFRRVGALVELGRFSSITAMRENTAVISRNGTSTTMRFRKVVMLSSTSSLPWSL
jgi:hypothetical protein